MHPKPQKNAWRESDLELWVMYCWWQPEIRGVFTCWCGKITCCGIFFSLFAFCFKNIPFGPSRISEPSTVFCPGGSQVFPYEKKGSCHGMCPASGDLAGQSPKSDTPPKFSSSHPKNGGWKTILSYWEGNFSGAMLNFAGVINFESWRHQKHRPKNFPNSSPAKQKTLSDLLSPI